MFSYVAKVYLSYIDAEYEVSLRLVLSIKKNTIERKKKICNEVLDLMARGVFQPVAHSVEKPSMNFDPMP